MARAKKSYRKKRAAERQRTRSPDKRKSVIEKLKKRTSRYINDRGYVRKEEEDESEKDVKWLGSCDTADDGDGAD